MLIACNRAPAANRACACEYRPDYCTLYAVNVLLFLSYLFTQSIRNDAGRFADAILSKTVG